MDGFTDHSHTGVQPARGAGAAHGLAQGVESPPNFTATGP